VSTSIFSIIWIELSKYLIKINVHNGKWQCESTSYCTDIFLGNY
jgi:hypothetical protein